ncbi:MAG: patatin-like phospholipase family protein [Symploca sp. SIO1B1]|nr:patatin-like phospholipase family protein [Symploca sp. SIO1B1]
MTTNLQKKIRATIRVVLILGIAILIIWLFRQYIYYLRIPILGILFLVLLPIISGSPILRNLFIFRYKWQLALVIATALIAGLAIANIFETIISDGPTRFNFDSTKPQGWEFAQKLFSQKIQLFPGNKWTLIKIEPFKDLFALLLGSLISITAFRRSKKDSELSRYVNDEHNQTTSNPSRWLWSGLSIGFLLGSVFIFVADISTSLLNHFLEDDKFSPIEIQTIKFIKLLKDGAIGYLKDDGKLTASHLSNVGFVLVILFLYVGSYYISKYIWKRSKSGQTRREKEPFYIPALFYLMLITTGIILLFGFLTFLLDYYLIPVLFAVLVFSVLMYRIWKVDHYYELKKLDSPRKSQIPSNKEEVIQDFKQALKNRLEHQGENRTLVVVCASGGGIQAAGWTVQVLTGLQQELGVDFVQAIGLISSVSGGSVGSMYYLDGFNQEYGYPEEEGFKKIFNSATANGLESTGWGLAYQDLWRFIGLPWISKIWGREDRGTAIEGLWQRNLKNPKLGLNTWRDQALAGKIPIPVFNATLVNNGYRFLLSPMTFVKASHQAKKYRDFNSLYGKYNYDIHVETAARLSATFPYVTPIARNYPPVDQERNNNYHVADGGYFDNFGVYTAVEWLDQVVLTNHKDLNLQKVVILQINAFRSSEPENDNSSTKQGWLMSLAGPLLAVFKVRNSTQTDRNDLEIQALQEKWEQKENAKIKIENVKIEPSATNNIDFSGKKESESMQKYWQLFINKQGEYAPPLSWKLSQFEKEVIKFMWNDIKDGVVKKLENWNK